MRNVLLIISLLIAQIASSQIMEISGTISERIDEYTKKNKIKKYHYSLANLGGVNIKVYTKEGTLTNVQTNQDGFFTLGFALKSNTTYFIEYSKEGYYKKISQIEITNIPKDQHFDTHGWDLALRKIEGNIYSEIVEKPFEKYKYNPKKRGLVLDMEYSIEYQYEFEDALLDKIEQNAMAQKDDYNIVPEIDLEEEERLIEEAKKEAKEIVINAKKQASEILERSRMESNNIIANTREEADESVQDYIIAKRANFDYKLKKELENYISIEKAKLEMSLRDSIEKSYNEAHQNEEEDKRHQIFSEHDEYVNKKTQLLSAKQKLEIDKLKAQTLEDRIFIKIREDKIFAAEQELKLAEAEIKHNKSDLALQDSKLSNQQNIIIFGGILIVAILALLALFYKSIQDKKKNAIVLERQKEVIEETNQRVFSSIKYAKRIQEAVLPHPDIWKKLLPNSFVLYMPKDIVSGDFYWVDEIEDKILFAAIDCTGHGVPGAFMSIVGYHSLHRAINEFNLRKPSNILDNMQKSVNTILRQGFKGNTIKDGMDIALCSLDLKKMELQYAGAYNPLWIYRDGEILETKATKQAVGAFMNEIIDFENHVIKLQKNDIIYILSDGYADQFGGPRGKKIMQRGVKKFLIKNAELSLDNQRRELKKNLYNWMNEGEEDQVDDICIIGVKV